MHPAKQGKDGKTARRCARQLRMVTATAIFLANVVHAQPSDALDAMLQDAVLYGQPTEMMFNNRQSAVAVPLPGSPCPTVGVIYRDQRHRGRERIDNYRVCPQAQPEAIDDLPPALPDNQTFRQLTQMTLRATLIYGSQRRNWQGYLVTARRLSPHDGSGCAMVETVVSYSGMLVSYNAGRLCP